MGNSGAALHKSTIDRVILEAFMHVQNLLNKRVEQLKKHEKTILNSLHSGNYSPEDVRAKSVSSLHHLRFIEGCRSVGVNLQQLKEHSEILAKAQTDPSLLEEFRGTINTIIWASIPLKLSALSEFNQMISDNFSNELIKEAKSGQYVDRRVTKFSLTI
jgi:DNA-binding transcriptional MerR regulator